MNRSAKATRRSFLSSIFGIFSSAIVAQTTTAQSNTSGEYPIGLPFEQLWEFRVDDDYGSSDGSISLAGIQQDTIYLIEQRDVSDRLLAFRKEDHERRWEAYHDGSLSSPIVVGDQLFVCGEEEFLAFRLASEPDGPDWRAPIDEGYTWDTATDEDTVWFTDYTVDQIGAGDRTLEISSGTLYAYAKDGTEKWSRPRGFGHITQYDGFLFETAETWQKAAGEEDYEQSGGRAVVRDGDSGQVKWRSQDRGIRRVHPPVHQDTVVAVSSTGTLYGYDTDSGSLQWQHASGSEIADITSNDTHIFYAANQTLVAYNPSIGEIEWQRRIPPAYDLTYDQQLLYVGDQNGNFHAFDAATGDQVWDHSLAGTDIGYEWIVDGTLYCVSGNWLAAFQGKQGRALSKLRDLRNTTALGTPLANLAGRKEALTTAEQEISNHNYNNAFTALNRAQTLGTAGDGIVWTTGFGTAYIAGRRATHEYKRHQFQELVDELTTAYPISDGVLKDTAPEELIRIATDAADQLSDARLGRPLTAGWLRDDDYADLKTTVSAAVNLAPRLQEASTNLTVLGDDVQTEWATTLTEAVTTEKFDEIAQQLTQLETAIELAGLRDRVANSPSAVATTEVTNLIKTLLTPGVDLTESDIVYCDAAATAISDYQAAQSTLATYDLSSIAAKLNEALSASEGDRDAATQNLKRIQEFLDTATTVESKRQTLDLQYITLSPQELQANLQYCINELALDELEDLATLVENLEAGVWRYDDLQEFSPTEFEKLVAALYEAQGYDIRVSQASNDKGIDVTAKGNNELLAIQVKQYSRGNKVGRPTVQQLAGARDQVNANKGVVVTSSSFTETARSASRSYGASIELIDGQQLLELLTKSPVSPPRGTSWSYSSSGSSGASSQGGTGSRQSTSHSTNKGHHGQQSHRSATGDAAGFESQFCMSCGQEYRGDLYEVTDPSDQPMYVCARCKELLEQSTAHQQAAQQESYEILGVEPGASQEEIEAAYRRRARETHPDTGGSKQEFLEVQEAYETLSDSGNS